MRKGIRGKGKDKTNDRGGGHMEKQGHGRGKSRA